MALHELIAEGARIGDANADGINGTLLVTVASILQVLNDDLVFISS